MPTFFRRTIFRNGQDALLGVMGGAWMGYSHAIDNAMNAPYSSVYSISTLIFLLQLNYQALQNRAATDIAEMALASTLGYIAGYVIGLTAIPLPPHLRLQPDQISRRRP